MDDWREIPGFPNYSINQRGELYNKSTDNYPTGSTRSGVRTYAVVAGDIRLTTAKPKTIGAHRLVALAFLDIPLTATVRHRDGDRLNNSPENLYEK